jgi:hypothetical protein
MLKTIATMKIPLERSKSFTVLFAFIITSLSFMVKYIIKMDKAQQKNTNAEHQLSQTIVTRISNHLLQADSSLNAGCYQKV